MNKWQLYMCEQIKSRRKARKLTQHEAGQALGQNQTAWSHWEAGTREPSIQNLYKIAAVLECSIHELLLPQDEEIS